MNTKPIAWITGSLTLLMALFSFVLSFNALTDLAAKHGISIPFLFPLTVEAGVIIFSLNALYRSLHSESAKWQWALIISSSLLAGTFNVIHAVPDPISQAMAAMPSLFLLLSFETFLGQIKHAVKLSSLAKSIAALTEELNSKRQELDKVIVDKQSELDTLTATKQMELDTLVSTKQAEFAAKSKEFDELVSSRQIEIDRLNIKLEQLNRELVNIKSVKTNSVLQARQAKTEQDSAERDSRLTKLIEILSVNPLANVSSLAEQLEVSRQTIYKDLSTLQGQGIVHKNGNGWEVTR